VNVEATNFFNNLVRERLSQQKKPAVVMEVFAGIGSGVVALKRLKIDIGAVITVEHDPAAKFVFESNHKDLINHKHIHKFEDVKIEEILESVGRKYVCDRRTRFLCLY